MMINKDFVMKKIGNEYIAAAVGNAAKNFNRIIKLNDTSAYIWHCIEPGIEKKTLIENYANHYSVDIETASADVEYIVGILEENNVIVNE